MASSLYPKIITKAPLEAKQNSNTTIEAKLGKIPNVLTIVLFITCYISMHAKKDGT